MKRKSKLWKVFANYIKQRDNYVCFTCGKFAKGIGMGAGHYKPAGSCGAEYYFSEYNVHAQCSTCNLYLGGNDKVYRERLLDKYGESVVNDIEMNYHRPTKWSDQDYQDKIDYYARKRSS